VIAELDRREGDVEQYIRPQRRLADIIVSFAPTRSSDPEQLDADLILRDTLRHPDLSPFLLPDGDGPTLVRREHESLLRIPGDTDPKLAAELEDAVWTRMQHASHLRAHRLGEFTIGTDLHRSESLALAQTLLLYHMVATRAEIGAGIDPHDRHPPNVTGADSALHA
jgi:phosphoribulokinase